MPRRVLVLGATGMLGASIFRGLAQSAKWEITGTVRDRESAKSVIQSVPNAKIVDGVDALRFETVVDVIRDTSPDVVINCIGVVKQVDGASHSELSIELNSLFPHRVGRLCSTAGARMIHFSTDCVFTGTSGGYVETDLMDASDLYGRSKSLGEVAEAPHLTLRTSIIGHEVNTAHSLIDWYLSQEGTVKGYRRAIFSGLPTVMVSQILDSHILESQCSGVYHLSADPINKFDLLSLVRSTYGRGALVEPCDEYQVDKSLDSSRLRSQLGLSVGKWPALINEMWKEYQQYFGDRI